MAKAKAKPTAVAADALIPGTVYAAPLPDGRWTAYQIVSADGERPTIVDVAWLAERPPTLDEARAAGLLRVTHHGWTGEPNYVYVDSPRPPATWRVVGELPVPDLGRCMRYASWPDGFSQVALERRWLTEIPEAARAAYKAATSEPIRVALGPQDVELPASRGTVQIGAPDQPLPDGATVAWSELDRLARLTRIELHGPGAGLVDHLAGRPLLDDLRWTHQGSATLDLSGTYVAKLSIAVAGPLALTISDRVTELIVDGDAGALTVTQPAAGARLDLHIVGGVKPLALPRGLPRLRRLTASLISVGDLGAVAAAFPDLTGLTLHTAGRLDAVERLADLRGLADLSIYNCYRLDAGALPPATTWPQLDTVIIAGHRKPDAATLKQRLGGAPTFKLSGGKTDAWLAANLDNPFREWIDRDARAGKLAAAAWRKARAALPPPPAGAKTEAVLRAFVDAFNAIDARHHVETIEREEIAEAFFGMAREGGVATDVAAKWFDEWRDF